MQMVTATAPIPVRMPGGGLHAYERYRTHNRATAESGASRHMSPHTLSVRPGDDLRAVGCFAEAGGVGLVHMAYGAQVTIDREAGERYLALMIPVTGRFEVRTRAGTDAVVRATRSIGVIGPGERVRMRWSSDCAVFSVRLDMPALAAKLRQLAPAVDDRPLRFPHGCIDLARCAGVYGAAQLMAEVLEQYGSVEQVPRRITDQLVDQVLGAALLGVAHNQSRLLWEPSTPARASGVLVAVDLVQAERRARYSVAELARAAGVTVRALELGFRKELGTTPSEYLRRTRLEKARSDLLAASDRHPTVTDVAVQWGFAHSGRFAATYRTRYGELPSVTRRRGA